LGCAWHLWHDRDLAPRNVLVDTTGPPYLAKVNDFGLSRMLASRNSSTGEGLRSSSSSAGDLVVRGTCGTTGVAIDHNGAYFRAAPENFGIEVQCKGV